MSSGMRSQAEKETAYQKATGNAAADMAAPEQVAQMQASWLNRGDQQEAIGTNYLKDSANFLGMGLGAQMNANQGYANAINGVGSAAVNQQNTQNQLNQQKTQMGMDFAGGAAGLATAGMAGGGTFGENLNSSGYFNGMGK